MTYYKLGCNWGSGKPYFLELLLEKSIVICGDKEMKKGDWVAIAQGFYIVALAKLNEDGHSSTDVPDLENSFEKYQIDYEDWNLVAKASIWTLPEEDKFRYQLQQGICQIQNDRIQDKIHTLTSKIMGNEIINKIEKSLSDNKNIILHGAPGTGKTYLARNLAAHMMFNQDSYESLSDEQKKQIGFVQFHPSYDYTDFVEGLRPVQLDGNDTIGFERRDGIFKDFCKKALATNSNTSDNFDEAWDKLIDDLSNGVKSEIEVDFMGKQGFFKVKLNMRGNGLMRPDISGGYFSKQQLYNVYRGKPGTPSRAFDNYRKAIIEKMKKYYGLKNFNAESGKDNKNKYVFVIDEINRGDMSKIFGELFFSIDPGYRGEKGKVKTQFQNLVEPGDDFEDGFYVPDNVYIIGTMNDIDRSVENMDFAMRRRFTFKEITAQISADFMGVMYDDSYLESLNKATKLSQVDF